VQLRLTALVASAVFATAAHAQDVDAGRKKAEACAACHGPDGNSTQPQFPILAGQTARYLDLQLRDFKEGRRKEPQMDPFVQTLSRADMFDLAAFFAAQKLRPTPFKPDPVKAERGRKEQIGAAPTLEPLRARQIGLLQSAAVEVEALPRVAQRRGVPPGSKSWP